MVDTLARNVLLDVEQAIDLFDELIKAASAGQQQQSPRAILSAVVHKLCEEELGHVLEIVRFLRSYHQSGVASEQRIHVLLVGIEELLRYLDSLVPCVPKTGCMLLVYGVVDELFAAGADFLDLEESLQRVVNLKHSLEYVVRDVASTIAHPLADDDCANLAALFEQVSYDLLKRLVDEAYADYVDGLAHICDFVEHLPCIDQQISACQVLYRRMNMDAGRVRSGATVLAYRIRKVMKYTDFGRSKHADEMRKLKLKLPEGVYGITWTYVNVAGSRFMAPKGKYERVGELKCKPAGWIETCSKTAKHEFQTDDRGATFAVKNTHTGLFLTDLDGVGFCYVETTPDRWSVEVIKRGEDVWYKITNRRTGNALVPTGEVRVGVDDDQCDGFNLVDFNERSLVVVQKFELHRKKPACVVQ
uniref:Uncharacterized protein n=1 Tax=Anopheles atroparvus TaxID=41427 RepID=A0A182J942_ANOAO